MSILVAITGGSGSGKSTLAEAVVSALPPGTAVLLREDSYYRDAAGLPDFDTLKARLAEVRAAARAAFESVLPPPRDGD